MLLHHLGAERLPDYGPDF
jgi:hypothetical protein